MKLSPSPRSKLFGRTQAEWSRLGVLGASGIDLNGFQMALNITHCLELQQLLLLDAGAEAGFGFNLNFVIPQGIDADVLDQAGVRSYRSRVGT